MAHALNYEEISKDSQKTIKVKPFINKYNWVGKEKITHQKNNTGKKIETINLTVVINVLYAK